MILEKHREILVKILAIIGFFTVFFVLATGIISGVQKLPEAFSSLASLAERINTHDPYDTEKVATSSLEVPTETSSPTQTASLQQEKRVDLRMTILGSGSITDTVFSYTKVFSTHKQNALRFDVKNVGSVQSGAWNFSLILPNGELYTSPTQKTLSPSDHVEFTLGFFLEDTTGRTVTLTPTLHAETDSNQHNNTDSLMVSVVR